MQCTLWHQLWNSKWVKSIIRNLKATVPSPRIRKPPFELYACASCGMEINHYRRSFVVIVFQNQTRVGATPQTIESCFLRLGRQRCHRCYSWSQVGFVHGGWAHCSGVSMVDRKQGKWSESLITWRAFSCYTLVCRQWFKGGMTSYGACFLYHILPSSLLLELIIIIFRPFRLLAFNQCLRARILWKIHSWQSFSQCGSKARSTEKGCKSDAVVSWIFPHLILRTSYIRTYLELPCM